MDRYFYIVYEAITDSGNRSKGFAWEQNSVNYKSFQKKVRENKPFLQSVIITNIIEFSEKDYYDFQTEE